MRQLTDLCPASSILERPGVTPQILSGQHLAAQDKGKCSWSGANDFAKNGNKVREEGWGQDEEAVGIGMGEFGPGGTAVLCMK